MNSNEALWWADDAAARRRRARKKAQRKAPPTAGGPIRSLFELVFGGLIIWGLIELLLLLR